MTGYASYSWKSKAQKKAMYMWSPRTVCLYIYILKRLLRLTIISYSSLEARCVSGLFSSLLLLLCLKYVFHILARGRAKKSVQMIRTRLSVWKQQQRYRCILENEKEIDKKNSKFLNHFNDSCIIIIPTALRLVFIQFGFSFQAFPW